MAEPEQLPVGRQDRPWTASSAATLRVDVRAMRSHGRAVENPPFGPPPHGTRSRLVAVPLWHEPTDQATAALGRWVDDLHHGMGTVARPDLSRSRGTACRASSVRGHQPRERPRRSSPRRRQAPVATPGVTGRGSRARSSATPHRRTAPHASGWPPRSPRRPSACGSARSRRRDDGAHSTWAPAPDRLRIARRRSSARGTNRRGRGTPEEAGLGPVLGRRGGPGDARAPPAEATRVESSCSSLKNALKTSSRKPSTPRSSQPRTIVSIASRTAGLRQFTSGCSRNVHIELATDLVPRPRRTAEEGRPVVRFPDAPEPVVTPSRHRYQSPYGRTVRRDSSNQRWAEEVWFITRSSMIRMPRRCASATRRSKSARVPKTGSIAS